MPRRSKQEIREETEQLAISQRRERVITLHLMGKTSRQIAAEVGCSPSTVWSDVQAISATYNIDDPEVRAALRTTHILDHEVARAAVLPQITEMPRVPITTKEGDVVRDKDGNPLTVPVYKMQHGAIDRLLKVQERAARLLGLDEPARQQVEGNVSVSFPGLNIVLVGDYSGVTTSNDTDSAAASGDETQTDLPPATGSGLCQPVDTPSSQVCDREMRHRLGQGLPGGSAHYHRNIGA